MYILKEPSASEKKQQEKEEFPYNNVYFKVDMDNLKIYTRTRFHTIMYILKMIFFFCSIIFSYSFHTIMYILKRRWVSNKRIWWRRFHTIMYILKFYYQSCYVLFEVFPYNNVYFKAFFLLNSFLVVQGVSIQ